MIDIQFPGQPFKIKQRGDKQIIFDTFRKRWVTLTPEEWVRQNFLQHLVIALHYPATLIAVEKEVMLGDMKKRFDIVVFKESRPWMIVECKELEVPLSEAVLQQILNYNISLQVQYLVVTNGRQTLGVHIQHGKASWLTNLPQFA